MNKPQSLKMRAIALLSRREQSPAEMRRKLLRIRAAMAADEGRSDEGPAAVEEVDALLTWLQAHGYLSESRFVESRVHARAHRYGSLRIKQELAQHGLSMSAETQAELKASELDRARTAWQRKFCKSEEAPRESGDAAQRAREMRFLSARGFAPDVIRRVLQGSIED